MTYTVKAEDGLSIMYGHESDTLSEAVQIATHLRQIAPVTEVISVVVRTSPIHDNTILVVN